jgi:hypothetical protein
MQEPYELELIPLEVFKQFDQEVIVEIMSGSDIKYAQRFFDRFSHVYAWVLVNEPDAQNFLNDLYQEEHILTARRAIVRFVEGDPLEGCDTPF